MRYGVLAAALLMPAIAWLSQRGAFGPDNGTISDRYPTLLVAQGYGFSIWGLIFLWDVAFGIWQLTVLRAELGRVRVLAGVGFMTTALWMPIFSTRIFWLGLAVICGSTACLVGAALALSRLPAMSPALRWLALVPLSLHAGWLSLAAFLNLAQVIVAYELASTAVMLPWSLALFVAAGAMLLAVNAGMRGNVPYALAVAWGLIAVFFKQSSSQLQGAPVASWVAIALLVVILADTAWLRLRARQG